MVPKYALQILSIIGYATSLQAYSLKTRDSSAAQKACALIKSQFPHLVSFIGEDQFESDIEHWAASSEQTSTCSVEPTNSDEVSGILKLVGQSDIRAPFAVKSGGHAFAQNFSSTPGVQISLSKFTNVTFDAQQNTVTIGVALTWDQVYEKLEPYNVTVAGGRIVGVGVGGLSLGGGYSWRSDQYGLTIDNIISHDLVLPNGEQIKVTNESNPDLFFALKGGMNNFGIVTEITFNALPQGQVYAGTVSYSSDVLDQVTEAFDNFNRQNTDPRIQIMLAYGVTDGQLSTTAYLSLNSPESSDIFDSFLSIPFIQSDVKVRDFTDFMSLIGTLNPDFSSFGYAGHAVPMAKYSKTFADSVAELLISTESKLKTQYPSLDLIVGCFLEPFINANAHSLGGAYPHPPDHPLTPISPSITYYVDPNLTLEEKNSLYSELLVEARDLSTAIQTQAVSEGLSQWDDILYLNYAAPDTPLELLYGENLPRLRDLAAQFDPEKVMTLTGGFLFQS